MKKFFRDLRSLLRLMSIDIFGPVAGLHLRTIKADLAIRHAVEEARIQFNVHDVRYYVVPTPEGILRVINAEQAREMIRTGYFPKSWKLSDIYRIAFFYTDACSNPKHGHSYENFSNMDRYYQWWRSTHPSLLETFFSKVFDIITWISDLIHNR